MKERSSEIETAKTRLTKLKSVISWKTLVITKKFMTSPRRHEAELFAKNYKVMAHHSIDKKIEKLNVTKRKVSYCSFCLLYSQVLRINLNISD